MATCVLHGDLEPGELGTTRECGPVHIYAGGNHTLNGDPCYPVPIRGTEGVVSPDVNVVARDRSAAVIDVRVE